MQRLPWPPYFNSTQAWAHVLTAFLLAGLVVWWNPALPSAWPLAEALHHLTLVSLLYLMGRLKLPRHLAFGSAVALYAVPLLFIAAPLGHFTYPFAMQSGALSALIIIALAVGDFRWNARPDVLLPLPWLVVIGAVGMLLLPSSQNIMPWLPTPIVSTTLLSVLLALFGIAAAWHGRYVLVWVLALTLCALNLNWLPQIIGWQYVLDPLYFLLAVLKWSENQRPAI